MLRALGTVYLEALGMTSRALGGRQRRHAVRVRDPAHQQQAGSCTAPGNVYAVALAGAHDYVACASHGLCIVVGCHVLEWH